MPRRRSPIRLHHSDTLLMLVAVLTATAFTWLVLALSKGPSRPSVAYSVEAPGVRLPALAANQLLRKTVNATDRATATVVTTAVSTSIGVVPLSWDEEDRGAAEQLAGRFAERLRSTDWPAMQSRSAEQLAERLYALDVRIRDAVTQSNKPRVKSAIEVGRLLRERAELLQASRPSTLPDPISGSSAEVTIVEHPLDHDTVRRPLAIGLLALAAMAATVRLWIGRRGCDPMARRRPARVAEHVRPLGGLVLNADTPQRDAA